MNAVRQILKNTMTGWLAVGSRALIALVLVPFLLSYLGKEGYGLLGLLGVIVGFAEIADLGLRSALGRELAEQVARKDLRAFNELASTALLLYLGISAILAAIGWFFAPWFVDLFKVSDDLKQTALWLIRIYGTSSVILSFITPVFSAGLTSYHRFDVVNSIQIVGSLVSSALLFLVIPLVPNPLYGWVGVMLAIQIATLVITFGGFCRYCEDERAEFWQINLRRLVPLFHLGGYLYVIRLAQTLSDKADPLILSSFLGPIGVALYQPASKLSLLVNPVVMTLTGQLYPVATSFSVTGDQDKLTKLFCLGAKYTLLPGGLVSAGIFIFAEPFARLWLFNSIGGDYLIVAQVMRTFAIVDLLSYTSGTQWPVLLGMKRLGFLAIVLIVTAVMNILLSVYFVGYTSAGVVGVLYGTIISKLIRIVFLNIYVVRLVGMRMIDYISGYILDPLYCLIIAGGFGWGLERFFGCHSWIEFIICAGLTACVWAISCWFIGLGSIERQHVLAVVKKIVMRKRMA